MSTRTLLPKDIYNIKLPGQGNLSPDGKHIAYTVKRIDEKTDKDYTDLYITPVDSISPRRLTFSGQDQHPHFSPDASRLAFISRRSGRNQIWILELDGGDAWHLPTHQAVSKLQWSADGKKIFYSAGIFSHPADWQPYPGAPEYDAERLKKLTQNQEQKKDEPRNDVKVITSFRYRMDGDGYFGASNNKIFCCDVPTQAPQAELAPQGQRLTSGNWDDHGFSLSPDGKNMVVASYHGSEPELAAKTDLWLYDLDKGTETLLYRGQGPTHSPLWSPCGQYIAFVGHDNRCGKSTTQHLWLLPLQWDKLPLEQQSTVAVTLPLDRPVGAYDAAELRLSGGQNMFWSGNQLYFVMTDQGVSGLYKTDLTGQVSPVLAISDGSISSVHGSEDKFIYTKSSPNQLEEIYLYAQGQHHAISHGNDEFSAQVTMGDWEYIPYTSGDGQRLDAWAIYPTDFQPDKQHPLLLLIHGGPHGAYGPSFRFIGQQFAGQGYIVLFTNPRGSESYGQHFACCIDRDWGNLDYADIMAGVDALVARGQVDEDNMFAHGWSYGGYMSCWIATQTDRFKAICAGASVTNLLSDYGTSDITLSDEWEYGGQPWKDAAHLLARSPLSHVEGVSTPMLLMHGENDLRCPIGQTEEFYIALRRLGKNVTMIRYPDEPHGLRRPIHRVDRYQRLLNWFNYLCN